MNKVKVFTDVNADLTKSFIEENNIEVIPIYYHFDDGIIYGDENNLTPEEYYKRARTVRPLTIGSNPDKIYELFKAAIDEGYEILAIMFSGALSVGYNSAVIARNLILDEYPERTIEVIDSKRGSYAQGYQVEEAIRLLKGNKTIKEIKEYITSNIENFRCLFSVTKLDYLIKSGRITGVKGAVGSVLDLKPIFGFDEEGKLYNKTLKRGLKKVFNEISEDIKNFNAKAVTIAHANDLTLAKEIKEYIESKTHIKDCKIVDLSLCVASNSGEGSFGISYYK